MFLTNRETSLYSLRALLATSVETLNISHVTRYNRIDSGIVRRYTYIMQMKSSQFSAMLNPPPSIHLSKVHGCPGRLEPVTARQMHDDLSLISGPDLSCRGPAARAPVMAAILEHRSCTYRLRP